MSDFFGRLVARAAGKTGLAPRPVALFAEVRSEGLIPEGAGRDSEGERMGEERVAEPDGAARLPAKEPQPMALNAATGNMREGPRAERPPAPGKSQQVTAGLPVSGIAAPPQPNPVSAVPGTPESWPVLSPLPDHAGGAVGSPLSSGPGPVDPASPGRSSASSISEVAPAVHGPPSAHLPAAGRLQGVFLPTELPPADAHAPDAVTADVDRPDTRSAEPRASSAAEGPPTAAAGSPAARPASVGPLLEPQRPSAGLLSSLPVPEVPVLQSRPEASAARPIVEISIGRVEVRSHPAPPQPTRQRAAAPRVEPLSEYLAARRGRNA